MKSTEEAAEPENDDGVWSGDVPHSHQLLGDSLHPNDDPTKDDHQQQDSQHLIQVRSSRLLYF